MQIGNIFTKSVSSVRLLGITIDSKLNFKEHINNIIKLYALRRLRKFLTQEKANLRLFSNRKSVCLLPVNLDVLLKNIYAKI